MQSTSSFYITTAYIGAFLIAMIIVAAITMLLFWFFFPDIKEKAALVQNREQMFSIIAHDLQSPLKNLKGLTSLVASTYDNKDWTTLNEICTEVERAGEDMDLLLTNLLNWSQLNQNIFNRIQVYTTVDELLTPIIKNYSRIAWRSGRVLELDKRTSEAKLLLEVQLLSLVLRNLIDNAIKHSPPNSRIQVVCTGNEAELVFQISNTVLPAHVATITTLIGVIEKPDSQAGYKGLGIDLINRACKAMQAALKATFDADSARIAFTMQINKS